MENAQSEEVNEQLPETNPETVNAVIPESEPAIEKVEETVVEKIVRKYDPDEIILDEFWNQGKREIGTNELIAAGFDKDRIDTYEIMVGEYRLQRLHTLKPYTLEKNA